MKSSNAAIKFVCNIYRRAKTYIHTISKVHCLAIKRFHATEKMVRRSQIFSISFLIFFLIFVEYSLSICRCRRYWRPLATGMLQWCVESWLSGEIPSCRYRCLFVGIGTLIRTTHQRSNGSGWHEQQLHGRWMENSRRSIHSSKRRERQSHPYRTLNGKTGTEERCNSNVMLYLFKDDENSIVIKKDA